MCGMILQWQPKYLEKIFFSSVSRSSTNTVCMVRLTKVLGIVGPAVCVI